MCYCSDLFFFFFSSRRRHTRFDCDWSSDVCSSDLSRVGAAIGCRVDQQVEPGLRVLGHPTELARALDNMLNNAVQYGRGPAGDLNLRLEVHRDGSEAIVAVSDSGPGIAPDQIERLLRPFERGDASRSGSGGAGLGLAIV